MRRDLPNDHELPNPMNRKTFLQQSALVGGISFLHPGSFLSATGRAGREFPIVRVVEGKRNFESATVERAIAAFRTNVQDEELVWLFNNCFPNTLDTTVTYSASGGEPDTYVITGDIDAMWLRDSSAQVWPYMQFADQDEDLKKLIAGVINRQTQYVLLDPYANAFYHEPDKEGEWATDYTDMRPGVHERKYEIDSLCYPIRLAYHYWKTTGDTDPFDADWQQAVKTTLQVFRDQQQQDGTNPYNFLRNSPHATDTRPVQGRGYPVNPVGLICSAFRPSDDATVFSFLVPSNFFAVVSLK